MPTGRLPTGTSFTSFSSNIKLSFAILLSSCGTVGCGFCSRAAAEPREPFFGFASDMHDDDGNVIRAALLVGQLHKPCGGLAGIGFGLQCSCNFGFCDHARQAIRAEHQNVAPE